MEEYYELFKDCYPDIVASKAHVKEVFSDPENLVLGRRDGGKLIAGLILRQNVILFFGVHADHRGQGIGTQLLTEAEELVFQMGMDEIKLYGNHAQIMPGAPLYPGAKEFFENRGYVQDEDQGDYQDLVLDLNKAQLSNWKIGETLNGFEYRWALPEDREAAVNCAGEAHQRYEEVYWADKLYQPRSMTKVMVAIPENIQESKGYDPANSVCGTLIVDMRESTGKISGVGFASVKPSWAGQGIAANMVKMATAELKRKGFEKAYARCVSNEAAFLYEACGYEKGRHYFRGRKKLDADVIARQKAMTKEVYIQYRELEGRMDQIEQRIYDQFCQQGHQLSEIEKLQIYVKPQDFTAYYMINDSISGKVGNF